MQTSLWIHLWPGIPCAPLPQIKLPSPFPSDEPYKCLDGKQTIHIQPEWVIPDIGICSMRVYLSSSPEVNIYPKINISSRPLKMALHGTPGTPCPWCPWIVIFLHGPKKKAIFLHMVVIFLHGPKKNAFFMHNWKRSSLNLHCIT